MSQMESGTGTGFPVFGGKAGSTLFVDADGNLGQGNIVSKTANYTITATDYVVLCDTSSATFTISLPAASGFTGRIFYVKKTDTSTNSVSIDPNGTETLDDRSFFNLRRRFAAVAFISDGTNWFSLTKFDGEIGAEGSPMGLLLALTYS